MHQNLGEIIVGHQKKKTVGSKLFEEAVFSTVIKAYEFAITGTKEEGTYVLPDLDHPFSDI